MQPESNPVPNRLRTADTNCRRCRDAVELCVGYGLILATIWTPRPLQHWFYWSAFAWIAASTWVTFPGWDRMGLRSDGIRSSLWVVGVAVTILSASVILADSLHTLHHPHGALAWVRAFGGYVIWSFLQQLMLQGYFLLRLLRLFTYPRPAAMAAACLFALAHMPNPILTPATLLWGLCACLVFVRSRNLFPLAVAHALLGISISISVPGPVLHNMRVGLGYVVYRNPQLRASQNHPLATLPEGGQ